MTHPVELFDPLPGPGQEGTGTEKVGPVELLEEGCDRVARDFGVAPKDLPSRLGHRNLQPKPPVEGLEELGQGMRHHIVNINANPQGDLVQGSEFMVHGSETSTSSVKFIVRVQDPRIAMSYSCHEP
jgi:hypothetical protein